MAARLKLIKYDGGRVIYIYRWQHVSLYVRLVNQIA